MRKLFSVLFVLNIAGILFSQEPVLLVDLNVPDRQETEVNEPGYLPWPITASMTKTIDGITFSYTNGTIDDGWWKAGVQSPNYVRLASDGIKTTDLELRITGLAMGKHRFVSFHNAFDNPDNNEFSPMDVYLDGTLVYDDLVLSERVLSNDAATTVYLEFEVTNSDPVVIRYVADPVASTTISQVYICGFHLNTSDPKRMAGFEYPEDKDEHVDIDNDNLTFSWKAPDSAVSQNFYFGTEESAVRNATPATEQFVGNLVDTFIVRSGFYSMENYYWRVDPIDGQGDTTKGDVWYFKKRIRSFPEAEGYGAYALGGRGGEVVYVTNLDDSGPGSFRDAVENHDGPRTILFNVSGLITLNSSIVINDDYITVAGQSAPGKGICFRWAPLGVTGDNLIVQNLRVRLGIGITYDGMGLTGAQYSIIDHCSISWTIDEAFSSRGAKNITFQRNLISEALNAAGHSNYPIGTKHGYAGSIGGDIGSFHHNLLAHCEGRNWSLAGGLDGDSYYAGRLDIFNNVVYNWGGRATDGGAHEVNFVGNYYKKGAATTQNTILRAQLEGTGNGTQSYFYDNNIVENTNGTLACDGTDNTCSRTYELSGGQELDWEVFVDAPFFESDAIINSAAEAYKRTLSDVGCVQPAFDDHDIRIIHETIDGTYSCNGSYTGKPGLPDHEKDVGYWETYPGYVRSESWDSDLDGMPDWWENVHGMNPSSAKGDFSESNADPDRNGYTNLEEFLQWMDRPHYFLNGEDSLEVDLGQYARGFTQDPEFSIVSTIGGSASIQANTSMLTYVVSSEVLGEVVFSVLDTVGTELERRIGLYNGTIPADKPFAYTYYRDREKTTLVEVDTLNSGPSDTTSVVNGTSTREPLLSLYPNPASSILNISAHHTENSIPTIRVSDLAGRIVFTEIVQPGAHPVQLDISQLNTGIYLLHFQDRNMSLSGSFIKEE